MTGVCRLNPKQICEDINPQTGSAFWEVCRGCTGGKDKKGPGGCKPKLPADRKRRKDTITLLPKEWDQLDEIGPSRGKAVSKLLNERRSP